MVNASRSEVLEVMQVSSNASPREIRLQCMMLARKYHPDKWCERCTFGREVGMGIFKNIANAFDVLKT